MAEGDERPRIVATFNSYAGMLDAIRARVTELQINGERFDEYAGLPKGYLSKLIGQKPVRKIGMQSFQPVCAGLGLRCLFVVDEEAERRLRKRLPPRNQSYVRSTPSIVLTVRWFRSIGRKGAQARIDNSTKKQRQEWARKAAIARWKNGA
jgi:hypothetical protein